MNKQEIKAITVSYVLDKEIKNGKTHVWRNDIYHFMKKLGINMYNSDFEFLQKEEFLGHPRKVKGAVQYALVA